MTSKPLVSRTLATLRSAEFGFFGVVVYTRVHTPRRCGAPRRAGVLVLSALVSRPLRTSCAMVGNALPFRNFRGTRTSEEHSRRDAQPAPRPADHPTGQVGLRQTANLRTPRAA